MKSHHQAVFSRLLTAAAAVCFVGFLLTPPLYQWALHRPFTVTNGIVRTFIFATGTVFTGLLLLFNIFLWRTKLGRLATGWPLPDLRGTWRGTLTPTSLPEGVHNAGPIEVYLVVRQTAFEVRATLYSGESGSVTVGAEFTRLYDPRQLVYSYTNTPSSAVQHRSPMHWGMAILEMSGDMPSSMSGHYFTGRLSRGDLAFRDYSPLLATDFVHARQLSYRPRR